MSFDGRIDGDRPSFIDRFNATFTGLGGLGSGDTSIGEVVGQNKFKNIALFATNLQPPATNDGSLFGYGTAAGSNDTGASNI